MRLKSLFFLFIGLLLLATGSYADIYYQATPDPIRLSLKGNISYIRMARDNFYNKRVSTEPTTIRLSFSGSEATSKRKKVRVMLERYLFGTGRKFELRFTLNNYSTGTRYLSRSTVMNGNKEYNAIYVDVDPNVRQVSFTINPEIVAVATAMERESITYSSASFTNYDIGYLTVHDENDMYIMGTSGIPEVAIKPDGLNLKVESSTCTLLSDNNININMPTIQSFKLRQQGEIDAGNFELRIGECGAGVPGFTFSSNAIEKIFITFSDASTPTNYSDLLSLSDEATASGVGIKIYPENSTTAVQFGPPSRIKGNHNSMPFGNYIKPANDYGSASQRYVVKYALDSSKPLKGGKVIARATFTFSYQ